MFRPVFGEMTEDLYASLEERNERSTRLVQEAERLMENSTRIDLGSVAELILTRFPTAVTCVLLADQRESYEGVVFVGHLQDAEGKEFSFAERREAERMLGMMSLAAPKKFLNKTLNLVQLIKDAED